MKTYIACGMVALGLLLGCASETEHNQATGKTSFNNLPTAVQTTIKDQAPNAKIIDIDRQTLSGSPVYEISLIQSGKNRKLRVAEDGTIIKTQEWISEKSGASRVDPEK